MLFFKLVATDKGGVMQLRIKTVNEDGCEVEEVWLLKNRVSTLMACAKDKDCPESLRREVQAILDEEKSETDRLVGLHAIGEKGSKSSHQLALGEGGGDSCQFVRIMDPEATSWLKENVDWIPDFVDLMNSDVATLEEKQRAIQKQTDVTRSSVRYWRAVTNGSDSSRIECARLIHADASIALVLMFRSGRVRLSFPDGYEGPTSFGLWNKTVECVERLLARAPECIKRLVAHVA